MNALSIASTMIRQDAESRYCLNDLHVAAGGEKRHRPNYFLGNKQTQALILELDSEASEIAGIPAISTTQKVGTFVAKELVYAYAMWVSPAFHLKVIRAYDATVTGEINQHEAYWFSLRPHWPAIRARVLAGERYRDIAAALGYTVGRVVRAVRRMIAVGLLAPAKVALVQRGPAKRSALMQAPGWGQQLALALGC